MPRRDQERLSTAVAPFTAATSAGTVDTVTTDPAGGGSGGQGPGLQIGGSGMMIPSASAAPGNTRLIRIEKIIARRAFHVDRVACPWLIRRFVDSEAEFLFVPASQVLEESRRLEAIPFDIPNVELGHHGELCSFDSIIKKYGLKDKALLRLARIVNAADTDRLDADPIAAGFEAIAVGYSLRFPDDLENLRRQFEVYDALYAWCRLQVAAEDK